MRNALAHAGKSSRRVASAFMATAFAQDSAEAAKTQWRKVADQLRPKLSRLPAFMDEAETDVLALGDGQKQVNRVWDFAGIGCLGDSCLRDQRLYHGNDR